MKTGIKKRRDEQNSRQTCRIMRDDSGLTLWLSELALLNTGLDGLVELGIESSLRREGDIVVRPNILLDGLAAVAIQSQCLI